MTGESEDEYDDETRRPPARLHAAPRRARAAKKHSPALPAARVPELCAISPVSLYPRRQLRPRLDRVSSKLS